MLIHKKEKTSIFEEQNMIMVFTNPSTPAAEREQGMALLRRKYPRKLASEEAKFVEAQDENETSARRENFPMATPPNVQIPLASDTGSSSASAPSGTSPYAAFGH